MDDFLDFIMEAMDASEEEFCRNFPDPFLLVDFEGIRPKGELETALRHRQAFAETVAGLPVGLQRIRDDKICTVTKTKDANTSPDIEVGRSPDNDIVLDYPRVSKHHATILHDESKGYILRDAGSTNGTVVNEKKLEKLREVPLGDGDRIEFGGDFLATFYTPVGLFAYINQLAEEEQIRRKRDTD